MSNTKLDRARSLNKISPAGVCDLTKRRRSMEQPSRHVVVVLAGVQERGEMRKLAPIKPTPVLAAVKSWRRLDSNDEAACVPLRHCQAAEPVEALPVEESLVPVGGTLGKIQPLDQPESTAQLVASKPKPGSNKRNQKAQVVKQEVARHDNNKNKKRFGSRRRKVSIESELRHIEMHEKAFHEMQKQMLVNLKKGIMPADGKRPHRSEYMSVVVEELRPFPNAAIECRNLSYQVGLGAFQKKILRDLSMTVPEGAIYGLLGPSGCGKTTLLRCVAGRLEPGAGSHLRVFGFRPNERGSQIPGPAIGYMPQEVSIYEEFTIRETLTYFGLVNRMERRILNARIDFLLRFLNLPMKQRLIKTLSGGQQRRVSLAVALVHSPPLLILDEPTVGVDPLLRQVIWNYLVSLAGRDKTTIIITTHYVEEARQAHMVGMMRNGRLLAENEPNQLMRLAGSTDLESVFLKLCVTITDDFDSEIELEQEKEDADMQAGRSNSVGRNVSDMKANSASSSALENGEKIDIATTLDSNNSSRDSITSDLTSDSELPKVKFIEEDWRTHISKGIKQFQSMEPGEKYEAVPLTWSEWFMILMAVTWKNMLRLRRNPPVLIFEFLLPAFQVVLFCLCIGGPPFDIPLAVVNEELAPSSSRMFLSALSPITFRQVPYENLSDALDSVRAGSSWAAVHIPERYTQSLNERLLHPAEVENGTVINGTITIYPDLTNLHLALAIEGAFKDAFVKFARDSLELLGYDPQLAELPVRLGAPIYGRAPPTSATPTSGYLEFMAPGVVISITYVMATGLTALAFILEKRDGLLERSQIAGVSSSQILLAHALLQVFVMALQIALVLAVTFLVFRVPSEGPLWLVATLVLLQGCAGMAFGLLISAVCREENAAIMMLVGTFYINLILAGIMWPIEAMPKWLRPISFAQPQTLPIIGLRDILARGWSLNAPSVQIAFITSAGWLLVFLLGAGLCMRYIK